MTDQLERIIINLYVAKLRNSRVHYMSMAITCVPRLDLDHYSSQLDSPRLVQRFLKEKTVHEL